MFIKPLNQKLFHKLTKTSWTAMEMTFDDKQAYHLFRTRDNVSIDEYNETIKFKIVNKIGVEYIIDAKTYISEYIDDYRKVKVEGR